MADALTPEAIYMRLGAMIADTPDITTEPTPEMHRWAARVLAVTRPVAVI
jgi:hypothetical protein